jgi:hypothetical protein
VKNKKCFDTVDARYRHEDYNTLIHVYFLSVKFRIISISRQYTGDLYVTPKLCVRQMLLKRSFAPSAPAAPSCPRYRRFEVHIES